jgi:uncharacterized protein YjiS (DUF1127 family)
MLLTTFHPLQWLLAFLPAARLPRAAPSPWRKPKRPQVLGAAELRGMSDYELKDLGIGRSEVPHLIDDHMALNRWA